MKINIFTKKRYTQLASLIVLAGIVGAANVYINQVAYPTNENLSAKTLANSTKEDVANANVTNEKNDAANMILVLLSVLCVIAIFKSDIQFLLNKADNLDQKKG